MSTNSTLFILKFTHNSEERCITFATLPSYSTLRSLVASLFSSLREETFAMKYIDDEDDLITIRTDLELNEAFRLSQSEVNKSTKTHRLKIHITSNDEKVEHEVEKDEKDEKEKDEDTEKSSDVNPPVNVGHALSSLDSLLLYRVQKQIEAEYFKAISSLNNLITHMDLRNNFTRVISLCDHTLAQASTQCKEKFNVVKEIVQTQTQGMSFEEQMSKLKSEFVRIMNQIQAQINHQVEYPGARQQQNAPSTSPLCCVSEEPQQQVKRESLYPKVEDLSESFAYLDGFEIVDSPVVENSLPPTAALQDLSQLESMGFVDKLKNLQLLDKHKGDLAAVIDELLS